MKYYNILYATQKIGTSTPCPQLQHISGVAFPKWKTWLTPSRLSLYVQNKMKSEYGFFFLFSISIIKRFQGGVYIQKGDTGEKPSCLRSQISIYNVRCKIVNADKETLNHRCTHDFKTSLSSIWISHRSSFGFLLTFLSPFFKLLLLFSIRLSPTTE